MRPTVNACNLSRTARGPSFALTPVEGIALVAAYLRAVKKSLASFQKPVHVVQQTWQALCKIVIDRHSTRECLKPCVVPRSVGRHAWEMDRLSKVQEDISTWEAVAERAVLETVRVLEYAEAKPQSAKRGTLGVL